jgi:glucose-1-phosphate cytidylyltransferase
VADNLAAVLPTVVILCGGRGTRLQRSARDVPKPLVEIGGRPILWHVIRIYLHQGFRRFLLLTGYLADQIEAFIQGVEWPEGTVIECLDTGIDTPTGGRVWRAAERLGSGRFCLTYADGVADVDLAAVLAAHDAAAATGTMTVVQPELPFGVAELDDDGMVRGFVEKPRSAHWINGGFMVFEPAVLDVLSPDAVLEREPLATLAGRGELHAFRHAGFWDCMDTYKDQVALNDLWEAGEAPWRLWA